MVCEHKLIGNFLSGIEMKETMAPVVFPDNSAGPDAVFCLGDLLCFAQVKFRESVGLNSAARSVSPEYFYVDKNGRVPTTFQNERNAILERLRGKKIVKFLFCYSFISKADCWKNNFILRSDGRALRSKTRNSCNELCTILVDGRNANSFFGSEMLKA